VHTQQLDEPGDDDRGMPAELQEVRKRDPVDRSGIVHPLHELAEVCTEFQADGACPAFGLDMPALVGLSR